MSWMRKYTCRRCGQRFEAARRDAKYCSAKCRKQMSLERQKLRSICKSTISSVKVLLDYCEREDFADDASAALAEILVLVKFTDRAAADAPGSAIEPAAPINVTSAGGTDDSSSAKSVTTGGDTLETVQRDVKFLEWTLLDLDKRITELEEAFDWSKAVAS